VLTLRTRPNEASVFVDGAIRGETRGQAGADFVPSGEVARYAPQEFSERLLIEDVALGRHQLEVRKPGFRPWRQSVEIAELSDYDLGAAVLEREAGTILLDGLPTDSELQVDGRVVRPSRDPSGTARLVLSPGSYRLSVTRGTAERFERIVDLPDQGEVPLEVQLRPSVILLGVLGGDRTAAEQREKMKQSARLEPVCATRARLNAPRSRTLRISSISSRRITSYSTVSRCVISNSPSRLPEAAVDRCYK
jgi:hypothetical protein